MRICTRSLARVPKHARPKSPFVLLEFFRRNRQDFRKGWNYVFTPGRRRPQVRELPIVAAEPKPEDAVYISTYLGPNVAFRGPVSTCTLDKI